MLPFKIKISADVSFCYRNYLYSTEISETYYWQNYMSNNGKKQQQIAIFLKKAHDVKIHPHSATLRLK